MGERTRELIVLILGDFVCFSLALWFTLLVRYVELPSLERFYIHVEPFVILSSLWVITFYIAGLYDKHTNFLKRRLLSRIVTTQVINIVLAALLFFIIPFGIAPKTNLVIYLFISISLITVWRIYVFDWLSPKVKKNALLLASGEEAHNLVDEINHNSRYSYQFVKVFDNELLQSASNFDDRLLKIIANDQIELVVVNSREPASEAWLPFIFNLSFLQSKFVLIDFHKLYEDTFDKVAMSALHYDWFISYVSQTNNLIYDAVKRLIDVVGAVVLLVPSILLYPFIMLAIKIQDGGPLFYRTERVGQFSKPINIIKFRTMTGQDIGESALSSNLQITKVGKFLRKTRLDELPQLWNILRGDLSFIGPRPEMPALASAYATAIPYYHLRHYIKPGLSGWAQINHLDAPRQGVDIPRTIEKLSYDLHYLRRRSIFLDIEIMLKTIRIIVMRSGT